MPILWTDKEPERYVRLLNSAGELIARAPMAGEHDPTIVLIDFSNGDAPIVLARVDRDTYREADLVMHYRSEDIERMRRGEYPSRVRAIETTGDRTIDRSKKGPTH